MAHEATWVHVRIPADCSVYITENILGRRRVSQTCTMMKSSVVKKVLVKVDAYTAECLSVYIVTPNSSLKDKEGNVIHGKKTTISCLSIDPLE